MLATGGSYLQGATATLAKLDEGIARRERQDPSADPATAANDAEQLELLHKLRDRIQLSIERVSDILSGGGGDTKVDDVAKDPSVRDADEAARRRREELELLEERRRLLEPSSVEALAAPSDAVAQAYSSASAVS